MENLAPHPSSSRTGDPQTPLKGNRPDVIHSLEELPLSVAVVSSGPLGSVFRKDHTSWQRKTHGELEYWTGRIDSALGTRVQERPIRTIALLVGVGFLAGLAVRGRK